MAARADAKRITNSVEITKLVQRSSLILTDSNVDCHGGLNWVIFGTSGKPVFWLLDITSSHSCLIVIELQCNGSPRTPELTTNKGKRHSGF